MSRAVRIFVAALASMALLALAAGWYGWRDTAARLAAQGEGALVLAGDRLSGRLDRFRSLPQMVAGHPVIAGVSGGGDVATANRVLEQVADATGALDIFLMDRDGTTVAGSNWNLDRSLMGENFSWRPYFREAMSRGSGAYHAGTTSGSRGFHFSAPVPDPSGDHHGGEHGNRHDHPAGGPEPVRDFGRGGDAADGGGPCRRAMADDPAGLPGDDYLHPGDLDLSADGGDGPRSDRETDPAHPAAFRRAGARTGGIIANMPKIVGRIPDGNRVEGAFSDMRPTFEEARQSSEQ